MNPVAAADRSVAVSSNDRGCSPTIAGVPTEPAAAPIDSVATNTCIDSVELWLNGTANTSSNPTAVGPIAYSPRWNAPLSRPQPRCHLPTTPVRIPPCCSVSGSVGVPASISSGIVSASTQFCRYDRHG